MTRAKSKIPEIRAVRALPTVAEMAEDLEGDVGRLYQVGTEAQVANRMYIAHDAHRLREELRRGAEAVDLQDSESVRARTLEFLESCELAARVPLWGGLCSRGFGLSRQYVARWISTHQGHDSCAFLLRIKEAFADALASAALNGSVSAIPAIFSLKNQAGWRDSGADAEDVLEIDDEQSAIDIQRLMRVYGVDATESAPEAMEDDKSID